MFSLIKIGQRPTLDMGQDIRLIKNVTIGGQTKDGLDATNDLTYLVLESVAETRLTQPNLSVRLHTGTPEKLLRKCIEVVKLGFGMPAFKNDEVIIPSLLARGVSREDAYNYTLVGCNRSGCCRQVGIPLQRMAFLTC